MNVKSIFVMLAFCMMLTLLSACNGKQANEPLISIAEVKQGIEAEKLHLTTIDIPDELKSSDVEKQEGYEIKESGDKLFIYQYKDAEALQKDRSKLHNEIYKFSAPNPPMQITKSNVSMIYWKKDKNAYDIENKIRAVF